ncbi:MAG: hypothetical protein E6767_06255 [Dysgonomonas sp.]|nr:hypothetical protein [Dysgonomonas sp.]
MGKFVIHGTTAAGEGAGFGWINDNSTYNSPDIIKDIPDNSISNKGKIGTSIPTPLARIELFNTAFEILTTDANREIDPSYKKLVSDSLDLLQFLFEKGGTGDVTVEAWDIRENINTFADSPIEGHRIIADALTTAFDVRGERPGNEYGSLGQMLIFSYKGIVLGGYSPKTMTYTSPNLWTHIKKNKCENDFVSEDGRTLFKADEVAFMVNERNDVFKKYLRALVAKLGENSFRNYIMQELGGRDAEMARYLGKLFMPIANSREKVFFNNSPVDTSRSQLIMKPNPEVDFYKQLPGYDGFLGDDVADNDEANGGRRGVNHQFAPLVLCQNTGTEYIYLKDKWSHLTVVDPMRHLGIAQRKLPINGKQTRSENIYPFVYINDFLEEAIVNVDYDINDKRFATCSKEYVKTKKDSSRYLLPIRKEYFLFFTMKDLKEQMIVEELREDEVKVTLNIPIRGNGDGCFIPFTRIYRLDSDYPIIQYQTDRGSMMNIAVFPTYKLIEDESKTIWDEPKNQYEVQFTEMSSSKSPHVASMSFYPFKGIAKNNPLDVSPKERTKDDARSLYYELSNINKNEEELKKNPTYSYSFDVIELTFDVSGYKALVIPNWGNEVTVGNTSKDYIFAVDFGTSNTHIAYSSKGGVDPEALVIENQMMALAKNADHITELTTRRFSREFVPEKAEYPVKTASIEGEKYNAGDSLFSGINIGYMLEDEMMDFNERIYHYETDLKWAYQQNAADLRAKSRVEAYCMQTMWMIRNELLMNGTTQCRLFYFTPSCMVDTQKTLFRDAWDAAVKALLRGFNHNATQIKDIDEAVAPYYALVTSGANVTETDNIVNIDIGGGTTDIFYFQCRGTIENMGYISSVMFAGNDIWGNGVRKSNGVSNGIVKYALQKLEQNPPAGFDKLIKNCVKFSSADASSMLFKYDKKLGYTNILAHNNNICNILLVHYASIIYYTCDLLKKYELDIPDCISFTGKGSEYIKLFAQSTERIEKITRALLLTFLGEEHKDKINNVRIMRVTNPKELTANGGVMRDQTVGKGIFKMYEDNPIFTVGTGKEKETTYKNKDIVTSELQSQIYENYTNFINMLYDSQHLQKALSGSGFNFIEDGNLNKANWITLGIRSFEQALNLYLNTNGRSENGFIDSSIFFLTLKDAIYQMSQNVSDTNK